MCIIMWRQNNCVHFKSDSKCVMCAVGGGRWALWAMWAVSGASAVGCGASVVGCGLWAVGCARGLWAVG